MEREKKEPTSYLPLLFLVAGSALMAFALDGRFMLLFMGVFLCQFALLKLYSLKKFSEVYALYDILAGAVPLWGYVYPFIEFSIGTILLSGVASFEVLTLLIVLMGFGALGIARALWKGLDLKCACMGGALNVPLGFVSLFENISMIVMAAYILLERLF